MVESLDLVGEENHYDRSFERLEASLLAHWQPPIEGLDATFGVQAHADRAWENADPEARVGYENLALFAQAVYQNPIADLTVGARGESHSAAGFSFVPRAGVTRVFGDLHVKALYSAAFKAPGVANLELNEQIRPERTQVIELEAGWLATPDLYVALNVFDVTIEDAIVYDVDPETTEERYFNFPRTGTAGAEAVLKYRHARGFANLGYAFAHAGKNEIPLYAVPGESRVMLGMPQHKLSAAGSVELLRRLSIAPSVVFMSGRHGFAGTDDEGTPTIEERPAAWLVDLFVTWRPKAADGLTLSAGVHNLLDVELDFLQPYDGGQAALPDLGREVGLRLAYERW
jgi:outer membrane receptor protein involved in Fe transport